MANSLVAFLAAVGTATWLYTLFMRRTGGNTKSSLIVAAVIGVIVFVMVWSIISMIDSALSN